MTQPIPFPVGRRFQWGPVPAVPFYTVTTAAAAIPNGWRRNEISFPESHLVFERGQGIWFNDQVELERLGIKAAQRLTDPVDPLASAYQRYRAAVRSLRSFAAEPVDWPSIDRAALHARLERLTPLIDEFWAFAILPELAGYGVAPYLERELPAVLPDADVVEALTLLTSADRHSFFQEEELALLRLLRDGTTDRRSVERHARAHAWLLGNYGSNEPLSLSYFEERLAALRSSGGSPTTAIVQIEERLRTTNERRDAIISGLPHGLFREIAAQAGFFVGWHDHRKAEQLRLQLTLHRALTAASRLLSVPFEDLLEWTLEELIAALGSGPLIPTSLARQRRELSAGWIRPDHEPALLVGPAAERLQQAYHHSPIPETVNELCGTPASLGNGGVVRAAVRVLHRPEDGRRLRRGEILVAPMTSPEYIDAIHRASAIVTDVGGLTSHAAVVSRELGIPCIVDTKIATKVLKDGDLIELDATNGIVRKFD